MDPAKVAGDLERGACVAPMGHDFPPDSMAATVALFKRHRLSSLGATP